MIFLRYVSESFQRLHDKLTEDPDSDAEDRDEYLAENIFWVPKKARWSKLAKNSKNPEIGVMLDDAMRAIESDNKSLKGALPKVYDKESMDRSMLSGLMDLFTNFKLSGKDDDFDLIGRVYEWLNSRFVCTHPCAPDKHA